MKKITIEWKHYDKEGETCTRCNNTGDNIKQVLKNIKEDEHFQDIEVNFVETKLAAERMTESNSVFINGIAIEVVLNGSTSENYCHSCSCLAGKGSNCRTVEVEGKSYEAIPEKLILQAISLIL